MTDAGDRTIADAVKLLRAASGLSLAAVAARCPVSTPYIHKIETGAKRNPSREVVQSLDKALGAGGLLLALAFEDDPMKRRSLFAIIAATTAGGNEYLRLLDGIAAPPAGRVGRSDIEAVAQSVDFCTALDLRYGGGAAVGPARSVLGWAVRLLDCAMSDDVRLRLSSEVAALADRVAWANYDAGHDQVARGLYGVALKIARQGIDGNLTAHVLLDASTRESHVGNHGEAAALLRSALDQPGLLSTVRANLGMTYARHVANMGQTREALDHVQRAFEANSHFDPGQVPEWSKGFLANPAHLASVASRSYLFAGAYDQAIGGFENAVESLGESRGRGRAYALSLLALAYLRGGYSDRAAETVRLLADTAPGLKSMRVAGHMRTLAAELAHKGYIDESRGVRALIDRVDPGQ